MWRTLLDFMLSPAGYAVLAAIGGGLIWLLIKKLPAPTWARALVSQLGEELKGVADNAYRAHTLALARAREDGVVTEEEQEQARQAAIAAARAHLRWTMILEHLIKAATGAALEHWVERQVNDAVGRAKDAGDAAVAAKPPGGLDMISGKPEEIP